MKKLIILLIVFSLFSCKRNNPEIEKNLTIFYFNDVHGQIDNFAKVKHIIDEERKKTKVIVVCAGDIFSGNPIIDIYSPKGYPIIEIMNIIGVDIMAVGNHDFDYGEAVFQERKEQSDFPWVCANINTENSVISSLPQYKTISVGTYKLTFLGLIETNGKPNDIIPSTHPCKISNISFEKPENVVSNFENIKEQENADLYIALTHLGIYRNNAYFDDISLASRFPYFDLIIGGHTNDLLNMKSNNIPIIQAGNYLNYLGKSKISIKDKSIIKIENKLINLNDYSEFDTDLKAKIDDYNNSMSFIDDVIGNSSINHERRQVGCFYTTAFQEYLNVDVSFQNEGGIRSGLNEGEITKREMYSISPFNNGTRIYNMSVIEIKEYLKNSINGNYYSGILIEQDNDNIIIKNLSGSILADNTILSVGINDYIPSVYDEYFPEEYEIQTLTAAETLISYLETNNNQVNYPNCDRYFRFL